MLLLLLLCACVCVQVTRVAKQCLENGTLEWPHENANVMNGFGCVLLEYYARAVVVLCCN